MKASTLWGLGVWVVSVGCRGQAPVSNACLSEIGESPRDDLEQTRETCVSFLDPDTSENVVVEGVRVSAGIKQLQKYLIRDGLVLPADGSPMKESDLLKLEVFKRAATKTKFMIKEAKQIWDHQDSLKCLVLYLNGCSTSWKTSRAWSQSEDDPQHLDPILSNCFEVGRALVDIGNPESLDYILSSKKPSFLIIKDYSGGISSQLATRFANSVDAFGHILISSVATFDKNALQLTAESLSAAGMCIVQTQEGEIHALAAFAPSTTVEPTCERMERPTVISQVPVVNMEKHLETRWKTFLERNTATLANVGLHPTRFVAIDGRHQEFTPMIRRIARTNATVVSNPYEDHGFRRGVIGCLLSHLVIWRKISLDEELHELDAWLILEDDIDFAKNFEKDWESLKRNGVFSDPRWDILFLGYTGDIPIYPKHFVWPNVRAFPRHIRTLAGGTFAYIIRKRGAKRLLRLVKSQGIAQPIDWFMLEAIVSQNDVVAYITAPHLVTSTSADLAQSSTTEDYPLGISHFCAEGLRSVKSGYLTPMTSVTLLHEENTRAYPDMQLFFQFEFAEDLTLAELNSNFACLKFCYQLDSPIVAPDSNGMTCFFINDQPISQFLELPYAAKSMQQLEIHGALFHGDGTPVGNGKIKPTRFVVDPHWARLEQTTTNDVRLLVKENKQAFLSKHATSLMCLEGKCEHLGGLPGTIHFRGGEGELTWVSLENEVKLRTTFKSEGPVAVRLHVVQV